MGISEKDGVIGSAHARWLGDFLGVHVTANDALDGLLMSRLMGPRRHELNDPSQLITQ